MPTIHATDTLANLAATRAGASRAFARRNLDFCCHGDVSLAEACARKGIEVPALIREIEAEERTDEAFERWDARPTPDVIAHLVGHFHASHRAELPRLLTMAQRVEKVHGEKASCPRGLARELARLDAELRQHMEREEQVVFPMLAAGEKSAGGRTEESITDLKQEHEAAGAILATMRTLTSDHVPPPEACGTWRALYLGLAEFERDLMQHVCLENYVLFPRARRA